MTPTAHRCEKEIQEARLRVTQARVATMQLFESHNKPVDAKYLIRRLRKEVGADRVTVFRILNVFVEKGILRKLALGESKACYELNQGEHHHLVCEECGNIEDISDCSVGALEREIKRKKKFLVRHHSLEFFGLCSKCQKKK